jgi:hypothetical protein
MKARKLVAHLLLVASLGTAHASDSVGEVVEEGLGESRTLLHDQEGWRVYRARNKEFLSCFAFKLAEPLTLSPYVRGSSMALGRISGSYGFKIWIADVDLLSRTGTPEFDFGLFGRYTNIHVYAIEDGDRIISGLGRYGDIKLSEILEWEGEKHRIEVNTSEYQSLIGDYDQFDGVLDMTGIKAAFSKLQECHAARLR